MCYRAWIPFSALLPRVELSLSRGEPSAVLGLLLSTSSREQLTREQKKCFLASNLFRWLASNLDYWEGLLEMILLITFPSSWASSQLLPLPMWEELRGSRQNKGRHHRTPSGGRAADPTVK